MITVKVTYPNPELARGPTPFPQQSPEGKGVWGNYWFTFGNDDKTCDYWIVVDQILNEETCTVSARNTIFLIQEPPTIGAYPTSFINQFGTVITCHPDMLSNDRITANKVLMQPCLAWFVNKPYSELIALNSLPKTDSISLITTKSNTKRYKFAMALKKHFGDGLDLFGRDIRPIADKWNALAPYKYSITLENTVSPYYFSEKLADCYLAFTYPFYYGGSAERYFPKGSFTRIDINDIDQSVQAIEDVLKTPNHYYDSFKLLTKSRNYILNKYNFFPTIISIIEKHRDWFDGHGENISTVTLSDKKRFTKNATMFVKKAMAGIR